IDPTTPKEWVPYLIQGVNDWQPAFEKAGFKNAIYALEAPTFEEDSTWSLEDARHSAIVYKPSSTPNASGPHINDPRSGEIIESHVNWYHNVMSLLHKWYFIQCSPSDPAAKQMTLDTELMGELIRFVSSHEVGHTLGLRHNFLASAIYTPEQLRDVEFLKENGHATSIMDYARFNYVAQPGDNIPRELLFPRINHYDNWAIEWGYRRFPEIDDPEKELTKINQWVIEKIKNPLYQFGTESSQSDPRLQSEDLGNNHMVSNEYGIKNLKYIMNNLVEWTSIPNQDYETLKDYYGEVLKQYRRYINHVARWIGGVYEEPKTVEQTGAVFTHVEKSKQKEAWDFLKRHFFTPQTWIIPDQVLNKVVTRGDLTMSSIYSAVLKNMMSKRVMMNLCNDELVNGSKGYTMENFYADMNAAVWTPLSSDKAKAMCQRILQKCYVKSLIDLYEGNSDMARLMGGNAAKNDNSDIISMAYYQLVTLKNKLNNMGGSATNVAHYKFLSSLIDKSLSKNGNNSK
ncbi:MAG: zinc-dependent metalloprotease, partial [Bacteroidales bacterium]|nr:zinc-dependent metalloprotease [Bacteroidales bacterium]